jgi:L-cysteine:1D-myo-inositol 2-amino-2-deoxy-alpha-D-glucopyranoside ligase
MSMRYLGPTVDIHGGGYDLIFPHHECEIAQSESATGVTPFVRTWMHVAMVGYQGEKMSKSLGNLVLASEVLKVNSSDAFRLYLAGHHYRTPWEYIDGEIDHWQDVADKLASSLNQAPSTTGAELALEVAESEFQAAFENDLDTPEAIRLLERVVDSILGADGKNVSSAQSLVRTYGEILGLTFKRA